MGLWNWLLGFFGGAGMAKVDFKKLRKEIKVAASKAFAAVRIQHPDETFYAFALYSDDGAMTVCPSVNTEEAYQSKIRRSAATAPVSEVGAYSTRWGTAEWAYEAVGSEHFDRVTKIINAKNRYNERFLGAFTEFKGHLFATMVLALKDLDEEGFFGEGEDRNRITLFCTVSDSKCALWLEKESARSLNPCSVYRTFEEQWGTYAAEAVARHRQATRPTYTAFAQLLKKG